MRTGNEKVEELDMLFVAALTVLDINDLTSLFLVCCVISISSFFYHQYQIVSLRCHFILLLSYLGIDSLFFSFRETGLALKRSDPFSNDTSATVSVT